ncbi:conserved phage C-terminal domain-containing protein [Sporosarcina sp. GW1-11]|uniref:conserved phage C-terminal domain-containing protein n=1 Tax=Sporosarcina sp. GW1-11 TaxID=2899126 RepID=UPI00294F3380|nr:conserved phage C-terminal domain-containing protein [Sporosarcina sp. GW1-11]MDV6378877.1 conserved phage C-terminal domain-containing protein [Sporosarcina sp. GW1-11]
MKLLLDESPYQSLPSLVMKIGMKEALFLQQLHYRSLMSKNIRDGYRWVYNSYEGWRTEFPYWSADTIRRIIRKLEKGGWIVSAVYNRMKIDNTKWYRVNYANEELRALQLTVLERKSCLGDEDKNTQLDLANLHRPITKECKTTTKNKEYVEENLDVIASVINYLNQKINKTFKAHSKTTRSLLNDRISEGYTVDDFKAVINTKTAQWLNDPTFCKYLRPSTLFSATNFENYLNEVPSEVPVNETRKVVSYRAPTLDYGEGGPVNGL